MASSVDVRAKSDRHAATPVELPLRVKVEVLDDGAVRLSDATASSARTRCRRQPGRHDRRKTTKLPADPVFRHAGAVGMV